MGDQKPAGVQDQSVMGDQNETYNRCVPGIENENNINIDHNRTTTRVVPTRSVPTRIPINGISTEFFKKLNVFIIFVFGYIIYRIQLFFYLPCLKMVLFQL